MVSNALTGSDIWETEYHFLSISEHDDVLGWHVDGKDVTCTRATWSEDLSASVSCERPAIAFGIHQEDEEYNETAEAYFCVNCLITMLNDIEEWRHDVDWERDCFHAQIRLILESEETPNGLSVNKIREYFNDK